MIVTTTPSVEGYRITGYYGIVFGEVITGINFLRDFGAGIRNIVGGRSEGYEQELLQTRNEALQELEQRASTLEDTPRELIFTAQRKLEAIEAQDTARELATSGDTLLAYYRHRERVDAGSGGYVPTGYRSLDRLLGGGLLNSGFYILAARPGMGKTTFGLAVADQVAQQNGPVLFVSLEMDEEQLAAKRLARAAGISYDALMMGNLGDEERARAAEWSSKVSQIPVYTNRKPRATVDDIANMARKLKGSSCWWWTISG